MTLHISNPSKQDAVFQYRLKPVEPREKGPLTMQIASGRQVEIGHGWSPEEKAYVIKQLDGHGARDAAEAHGDMGKFLGLLYRDKGVIAEDEILLGHDSVVDTQQKRSATEATRAALGFDRAARKDAVKNKNPAAKFTEVSVREEVHPRERPTGKEVEFSMSVDPEGRGDAPLPL